MQCIRGAGFDVVVDLRAGLPVRTMGRIRTLGGQPPHRLYSDRLCAHGFQPLSDDAELLYHVCMPFEPELRAACDAKLMIEWPPRGECILSQRDAAPSSLSAVGGLLATR